MGSEMCIRDRSSSGSQTVDYFNTGTADYGDYAWVQFNSFLSGSEGLNGTLSGTWSSNVFDPGEASSVIFYWGTGLWGHPTADYLSVLHRDPFPTQAPRQPFLELVYLC